MQAFRAAGGAAARAVAWGGAAAFAASLSYFLFSYAVTFGEIAAGMPDARDVAWNVGLFSLFAAHHSVFARTRVRAWVARALPPQLERSLYVWIASLMLIAVCAFWRPVAGVAWHVQGPAVWGLYVAQLAGIWLTLRGAATIDVWELAGVRDTWTPPATRAGTTPSPFKTSGPYGWVRHPIYLGWIIVVFAVPTMTNTRLVLAVVSSVYLLLAIPIEERTLLGRSGGAYEEYTGKVRWRLVPWVW